MGDDEKEDFKFAEHQLGVIDSKANNVLMVDSVLIVISSLGLIFNPGANILLKSILTTATICVLVSVGLCLRTIWVKWATDITLKEVIRLRDIKTNYLHASLAVLALSLFFFVVTFVMDLFFTASPGQ